MKNYDQISLDDYSFKQVEVRLYLKEGETLYSPEPISSPDSAINVLSELMKDLDREMVAVVNLEADILLPVSVRILPAKNTFLIYIRLAGIMEERADSHAIERKLNL